MSRQFLVPAWGLSEYALTPDEAAQLQASDLVRVELTKIPGTYGLRAGSKVGVAAGSGWGLRVKSHLNVRNLMFMLCYARDPAGWKAPYAFFDTEDDLLSSTAWGFASAAERALLRGPLRGYRRLEERSPVLRGRLRIRDQIARGGLLTPVDIIRDEFDIDVPENRILLAAARLLRRLPQVHSTARQRLRRIDEQLDGVSLVPRSVALRGPPFTRLNRHYQPALAIAELVLRGTSIGARTGSRASVTFSFELHRVFEQFLEVSLGRAVAERGAALQPQMTGRSLDRGAVLGLRPDLVVTRGGTCRAILDAKFKRLDGDLAGDAYQMLAYLLEFGPARGFLVAADGSPSDHVVRAVPKHISVRSIRLDQPPERILEEVDALAAEIPLGDAAVGSVLRYTAPPRV